MPAARLFAAHRSRRYGARFALLTAGALTLAGCAEGSYPSLLQQPQAPAPSAPVAIAPPAGPVSPALAGQLADLRARIRAADEAFARHLPAARNQIAAAQGTAMASEAWLRANEALTELESDRADSAAAFQQLEQLYVDDRVAHAIADADAATPRPVAAAIADVRTEALSRIDREDAALTDLRARLPD